MKITLIGMSNTGKSYWSRKLEQVGFFRYSCDELIGIKLAKELNKSGCLETEDVARWMGQPYEDRYQKASRRYLEFENESLNEIIFNLKTCHHKDEDVVVDTTGSVIYTEPEIIRELRGLTIIICLDTPEDVLNEMLDKYIKNPKPVIWGNKFKKRNGESDIETLKMCYPKLLDYRSKAYKRNSHLIMEYDLLRQCDFSTEDFIYKINAKLLDD